MLMIVFVLTKQPVFNSLFDTPSKYQKNVEIEIRNHLNFLSELVFSILLKNEY